MGAKIKNDLKRSTQRKVASGAKHKTDHDEIKAASSKVQPKKPKVQSKENFADEFKHSNISPSSPNSVLYKFHSGNQGDFNFSFCEKLKKYVIINQIQRFKVSQALSPFERRVTSIAWHPVYSDIFVAGSKGGELTLQSMKESDNYFCPGIGAGGSIVGLKFDIKDPCTVFTASITGNIRQEDFHGKNSKTLLSTLSWENWFSCLDVCYKRNILLTGDCSGHGYMMRTSGEKVWDKKPKLHSSKITHCEFNQHDENIFVTSSIDHSMKLWDLRMVAESASKPQPLREYQHEKAINSAYFSPSNGLNLLTTDQHSQLRVYSTPFWDETLVIKHPHRQFQHMTSIKANWHPMEDIIIAGRYPDDSIVMNDSRTIDFLNALDGKLLHQIKSPTGNIVSLNAVNISGSVLASAAGYNIIFLKDENVLKGVSTNPESEHDDDGDGSEDATKKLKKRPRQTSKNKLLGNKKIHKKV